MCLRVSEPQAPSSQLGKTGEGLLGVGAVGGLNREDKGAEAKNPQGFLPASLWGRKQWKTAENHQSFKGATLSPTSASGGGSSAASNTLEHQAVPTISLAGQAGSSDPAQSVNISFGVRLVQVWFRLPQFVHLKHGNNSHAFS